ncbi:uncharacterized protein LOC131028476 [Cryptomeria japonica]|uniref:uncharacterized protein LOC131028476 n=1 Tax=Cryptomeria japonica TaxID=3369 RepID=UPI0025ACA1CB|nr:uncharacterized protein LOC131028476 [Cryptomeria japonica]
MWWCDPSFKDKLKEWWLEGDSFVGTPSFRFAKRLQVLKQKIKAWNISSFKNIFFEKLRIEGELEALNQKLMLNGMNKEEFKLENNLKEEYHNVLKIEEVFWRDKSRELWISEGDRNTKFFHASLKARRIHDKINSIKDEFGQWRTSDEEIQNYALNHFQKVLGNSDLGGMEFEHLVEENINKNLISSSDVDLLVAPYSMEEVKVVTFGVHPNKSPRPDGMTTDLF